MKNSKHWIVCLDLSQMDDVLCRYIAFLATILEPEHVEFMHIMETGKFSDDVANLFPELDSKEDLERLIRSDLQKKIQLRFRDVAVETSLTLRDGEPTDQIIRFIKREHPDLLVLGKKTGYVGEGVMASRIVKYVPNSVLFVPETSRHQLTSILIPSDFSEQSAAAIKASLELQTINGGNIQVIAQHVFRFPTHYFPYIPTDKEKQKIRDHLEEKRNHFLKKNDLDTGLPFVLSMTNKEKKAGEIYNEVVKHQVDMIILASKADKSLMSLLKEDFTDRMINYAFGIPLLIRKNKKKHERYLDAFLSA